MQFTLVSTIYNEAKRLEQTISDIENQTIQPSEIIITDAGSTDGSWDILMNWKLRSKVPIIIIQEKGCNVARGRNLAIQASNYEYIVSTDFGCRFNENWLQSLVEKFQPSIDVVGGAFTIVEQDVQTDAAKADYILQRGYPVVLDDYFSVSSRNIAYKKEVWTKIGGYPEWLTLAADDTIFWMLVKKHGFKFVYAEQPNVYWGRHKSNKAFAREAFRYGLGDGESRINYRNFWSNSIETLLRYSFFISLLFVVFFSSYFLIITILFSVGLRSYVNAFRNWEKVKNTKYNFRVFLIALWQLEYSRFQYLRGYIKGLTDKDVRKSEGRKVLWDVIYSN